MVAASLAMERRSADEDGGEQVKQAVARVQALCREGNAHAGSGEVCAAIASYERGLELLRTFGELRAVALKLTAGAAIAAGLAKQERAMRLGILVKLSQCYIQGQPPERPPSFDKALGVATQALELDPRIPQALLNKGLALAGLGRLPEAEAALAHAAKLAPENERVCRELERVRQGLSGGEPATSSSGSKHCPGAAPGTAPAPAAAAGQPASKTVLIDHSGGHGSPFGFVSPFATLGITAIDDVAAQIAACVEKRGIAAYAGELMKAAQYSVDLQYGSGARLQIERLAPCTKLMASQASLKGYEPGKGERYLTSFIDGLTPNQPFHDVGDHPWCSVLAGRADHLMRELDQHLRSPMWRSGNEYAPDWRSIELVKRGLWIAGDSFPETKGVLKSLCGVRLAEVCFACMPPHTKIEAHSDNTNFLLTAHLGLELEEGSSHLTVGEWKQCCSAGKALVFDHSYMHTATNDSDRDRYALICRFWHPGFSDQEAYAMSLLSVLIEAITRQGRVPAVFNAAVDQGSDA